MTYKYPPNTTNEFVLSVEYGKKSYEMWKEYKKQGDAIIYPEE